MISRKKFKIIQRTRGKIPLIVKGERQATGASYSGWRRRKYNRVPWKSGRVLGVLILPGPTYWTKVGGYGKGAKGSSDARGPKKGEVA